MTLWGGSAPDFQKVLLFNWKKTVAGVKGSLEIWGRDILGNPALQQTEVKFMMGPNPPRFLAFGSSCILTHGQILDS